jgi:hypothetical protein
MHLFHLTLNDTRFINNDPVNYSYEVSNHDKYYLLNITYNRCFLSGNKFSKVHSRRFTNSALRTGQF